MQRRSFIRNAALYSGALVVYPHVNLAMGSTVFGGDFKRYVASNVSVSKVKLSPKKRIPLGWPAFAVPATSSVPSAVNMKFKSLENGKGDFYFRITSAIDLREEVHIEVFLPNNNVTLATLELKFSHPFQPFETRIDRKWINEIKTQGLSLRMVKGNSAAWFYLPQQSKADNLGLQPQILRGNYPGSENAFFDTLYSMNSFSPFGWMGGCVNDALLELHKQGKSKATRTLKKHLESYLDNQKGIVFESPMTEPVDGRFNTVEDFLPFTAIATLYPEHPSIKMAVNFCLGLKQTDGLIVSGDHITTEGCYTLAYPLTKIALLTNDRALAETAVLQLTHRIHYLSDAGAVYQRSTREEVKGYRNWGRGIAWYMLGIAKTLNLLKNSQFADLPQLPLIEKEFVRAMQWVSTFQDANGMWNSYVDRPETKVDTTTTGGIATAMVWGVRMGLLPASYRDQKAKLALKGLKNYLTADGFVTHVSQINRGGESLQEGGYRVITQFGLGLMAQLWAGVNAKS